MNGHHATAACVAANPIAHVRVHGERDSDGFEAINAVLDLVEQAMRTAVDLGAGAQLAARAMRIVPGFAPPPAQAPAVPPVEAAAGQLGQLELSQILGALKDQRGKPMTGDMLARNLRARGYVLRAMRAGTEGAAA